MIKKIIQLAVFVFTIQFLSAQTNMDSLNAVKLNVNIKYIQSDIKSFKDNLETIKRSQSNLESNLKSVEKNQLNYKIEKDLLKETYSNNFERVNTVITIILGIVGLFGFFGIRDIGSIKKQYLTELEKLKTLQNDFTLKAAEFENEKVKFDSEINKIVLENQQQNSKIKLLVFH